MHVDFGAGGVGLAVGFFGYFVMLNVYVSRSKGKFNTDWFLDGRRKKPASDEQTGPIPMDAEKPKHDKAPAPGHEPMGE